MTRASLTDKQILNIPADVPQSFVKDRETNFLWEKMQCVNMPLIIDNYTIRPPSIGVWTMLEIMDTRAFVLDYENLTVHELARVLYVNEYRQAAINDVNAWLQEDAGAKERGETELDAKALEWAETFPFASVEAVIEVRKWFDVSWSGWAMFKGSGSSSEADYFGAVRIAGSAAACGSALNLTPNELLWEVSVCLVGHTAAQIAVQNGNKHIGRPKDEDDMIRVRAETKVMIAHGELLPWQKMDPCGYHLSEDQIKYGGVKLAQEYAILQKEHNKEPHNGPVMPMSTEMEERMLAKIKEVREARKHVK